jgi:hypothetical protein
MYVPSSIFTHPSALKLRALGAESTYADNATVPLYLAFEDGVKHQLEGASYMGNILGACVGYIFCESIFAVYSCR